VLRERPDVVISDLMMPSINGLELTRRIKQERPRTKVILMSAIHRGHLSAQRHREWR